MSITLELWNSELGRIPTRQRDRRDYYSVWRRNRELAGLCLECGHRSEARYCSACRDKQRKRVTRRQNMARRSGICITCCSRKAAVASSRCEPCLYKRRIRENAKRAGARDKKRCRRCGNPCSGLCCRPCLNREAERMRKYGWMRVAAGFCVSCGSERNLFARHCDSCHTKIRDRNRRRHGHSAWKPGRPGRQPLDYVMPKEE
jgi:hypothetical protein